LTLLRSSSAKLSNALLALLAAALLPGAVLAHPSRGVVVAPNGRIYFSDLVRIWEVSGSRLRLVHRNPGTHTHALALDPAGRLVWEESRYDPASRIYSETVWQLDRGRVTRRLGPLRPPVRGMGIHFDREGCTYHADWVGRGGPALVHRWCPGGAPARLFGSASDDRRFRPELINDVGGAVLAPDGRFLFRQGGMVWAVDRRGRAQLLARNLADENFGIALDPAGALLVAEHRNRRLLRILGGRTRVAATTPPGWAPTGAAAGRGFIVLLEASDHRPGEPSRMRLRKLGPGGQSRVLAYVALPQG